MSEPAANPSAGPARVGYVLKMFPRLSETFILNEILELEQQGLELQIFSLKRPAEAVFHGQTKLVRSPISYLPEKIYSAPWRVLRGQIHVACNYRHPWWRALRHAWRAVRANGDAGAGLAFCQACCLIRELRGIHHLHAHYANVPAKIALIVHRITGNSYSITTHAKDIFQNDPFASPKLRERMVRARFVVANSRFSANQIHAGLDGQGEIHTVYNGLDLEAFPLRQSQPLEPLILSVGRLVEKKGFGNLIAACQLLKQRQIKFTCELVGTGLLSPALKEQIRSCGLGDCLKMVGPLSQEKLRGHYARAMVFALPCIAAADGDRDILPNVIKEAMAVGVAVVTTRLDGIEELIEDGVNGLLVPPGDVPALAAKLEWLLKDSTLRQNLAAQGRRAVEQRFDRRANFAELKKLLISATQKPAADRIETQEPATTQP